MIIIDKTDYGTETAEHVYPQGHAEVYGAYIELDVLILVRA